jgi:hypothetical protein
VPEPTNQNSALDQNWTDQTPTDHPSMTLRKHFQKEGAPSATEESTPSPTLEEEGVTILEAPGVQGALHPQVQGTQGTTSHPGGVTMRGPLRTAMKRGLVTTVVSMMSMMNRLRGQLQGVGTRGVGLTTMRVTLRGVTTMTTETRYRTEVTTFLGRQWMVAMIRVEILGTSTGLEMSLEEKGVTSTDLGVKRVLLVPTPMAETNLTITFTEILSLAGNTKEDLTTVLSLATSTVLSLAKTSMVLAAILTTTTLKILRDFIE